MGLLDGIVGQVLGNAMGGGQQNALLGSVMGLLSGGAQGGGLSALVDQLKQNGLGDQVGSWIGTGQNLPVSADQIANALGHGHVARIAQQAGIDPQQASAGLAQFLPQIIDKLTPNGGLPQGGELEQGLASLKQLFGS